MSATYIPFGVHCKLKLHLEKQDKQIGYTEVLHLVIIIFLPVISSVNVSQLWDPRCGNTIDVCAGIINGQHKLSVLCLGPHHL